MTAIAITATPESVGLSSERLAKVDGWRQDWTNTGKLPCALTAVMRHGEIVHVGVSGMADVERGTPATLDTIFRIYSMTKPLTSTAIMMLYEDGRFQLDDPISKFAPEFANMRSMTGSGRGSISTEPAMRDISFRDLLSHTSGLTYGFMEANNVDKMYRDTGVDFSGGTQASLKIVIDKLVKCPLIAQPGSEWNYSVSTDVLGYLVQVISGMPFEDFLREKVIKPLGMVDTDFHVPADKIHRLAANYSVKPDGLLQLVDDPLNSPRYNAPPAVASGGGGLVGTAHDYMRFCKFMLNKGELDGVRLLGRKTVELMTANHLGGDMASMGQPTWSESPTDGIGFGLGYSIMLDPAKAQIMGTAGEYAWGGAASTAFWCDPVEDMAVVFMTQVMPSSLYPLRRELKVLTYQAVVE
ncbi:MAG: serine hydrolase domain-containing protein [Alphaproteobacteria bacterium]|jgi:CubicO group peptidase (beta-lactamase class C family)